MIGGTSISAIFGALPEGQPLTTAEGAKAYVRALCDAGVAVLFLHPGTKEPTDLRTGQKKAAEARAARDAAREAGRRDWERAKAPSGLYLATTDKTVAARYVDRYLSVYGQDVDPGDGSPTVRMVPQGINLAIEVGRSNLVVVDCDTAAQVTEFLEMCGAPPDLPPTVRSPGQVGPTGTFQDPSTWAHRDGGHFYFTVDPAQPLPPDIGSTVIGITGIAVLWHHRYVLIPPSVRAEGAYALHGRDYPLPTDLRALIEKRCTQRRERAAQIRAAARDDGLGDRIDAWAQQVSWLDLLEPAGWVPVSRPDNCGCPVLTAPGDHVNPKSATAHEVGCGTGMWDNDVNAPLHIWTTNPGEPFATWIAEHQGLATLTKFQVVALIEFEGNQARAMDVLGLGAEQVTVEGIDVAGIGLEEADPRNLDDSTALANLSEDLPTVRPPTVPYPGGDIPPAVAQLPDGWVEVGRPPVGLPVNPFADLAQGAAGGGGFAPPTAASGVDRGGPLAGVGEMPAGTGYPQPELTPEQQAELYRQHAELLDDPSGLLAHNTAVMEQMASEPAPSIEGSGAGVESGSGGVEVTAYVHEDNGQTIETRSMSLAEMVGGAHTDEDFPIAGQIDETSGLYMPINPGVPEMAPFNHWRDLPPPEFVVEGLLEHSGLTCIIGPPGAGKSTLGLDIACHVATGRRWYGRQVLKTKVLYLPGEGLKGVVQRLIAWEESRGVSVGPGLILGNGIIQLGATREAWAELREYVARQEVGIIVFDTFARMATNIDENSATDVGRAVKRFDQVRELTNCGVMVVHHTGKATPDVARGSSALNGALDSELLVRSEADLITIPHPSGQGETTARPIHLRVTKQKNAEQLSEEINLLMVKWSEAAPIITGETGAVDPMAGDIVFARPVPETLIETAARIRLFVDRFTEQGCTRTDIAAGVAPDPYTAALKDTTRRWKLKVAEAVDRSLRWQLLQTPEGTSARYVSGPTGIDEARRRAAEEVMTPDAAV